MLAGINGIDVGLGFLGVNNSTPESSASPNRKTFGEVGDSFDVLDSSFSIFGEARVNIDSGRGLLGVSELGELKLNFRLVCESLIGLFIGVFHCDSLFGGLSDSTESTCISVEDIGGAGSLG